MTFHMPVAQVHIKVLLVFHQWLSATIKFCKGILQQYLDILTTPGPNWWRQKAWHFFGIDRKTSLTSSESIKASTNKIITQKLIALAKKVFRVEICRDRHDRGSCKICASCVNFPGKQRDFSHNLPRTTRFTHTKCGFALKLLRLYTLS